MRRRNLLIGLGSIAAGGSALVGTGAVSSVEAERNVTGEIVGDGSAYLSIEEGGDHGFAVTNTDGEFYLEFENDPNGGDGPNPDSVNTFDDVFRIRNTGPETLTVNVRDSHDRLEFYFGETADDGGFGNNDTENGPIGPSDVAVVGVYLDLRDVGTGNIFTGSQADFTIVAEEVTGDDAETV
jgi:hypothetical protein